MGESSIERINSQMVFIVLAAALCVLLLLLLILFKSKKAIIFSALFFIIAGIVLGTLQPAHLSQERTEAPLGTDMYRFCLSSDSRETLYGSQAQATIVEGRFAGQKVLLFMSDKKLFYAGDLIEAETHLAVPKDEYLAYYDQRAIAFSADIETYQSADNQTWLSPVYQLRKRLLNIIGSGSDEQTLLRAILLGERSALFDAEFYHSIKVAGLAHLVAVSGAHLVIVVGFLSLILRALHAPVRASVALQTLFLLTYLILVGFPISCIRAALMSAIALVALMAKRRTSSLTALGIVCIAMMVFDPCVVYQLSFQLSVTATLGIVLFMPLFVEWCASLMPKMPEFVRESISMTLAALIFSLPITAAQFSLIPIFSPLANLVATPYLTVLLMFGFAALLFSSVVPVLLSVLGVVTKGLLAFFAALEAIPGAALAVSTSVAFALPVASAAAIILWLWWPTPSRGKIDIASGEDARIGFMRRQRNKRRLLGISSLLLISAFLLFCSIRFMPGDDRIVMLDVGQGDSFAFMSEGKTVLVDTGNEPEMLYSAIARSAITDIDAVIITHPDDDHCGSLFALGGVVNVGCVIVAEGLDEVDSDKVEVFIERARQLVGEDRLIEVGTGDSLHFGAFTFDIVAPSAIEHEGGNEDSICFYARIDCDRDGAPDWNAFFCGDAEAEVLEQLDLEQHLEPVDLYKVGHHGSRKALTPELAEKLSPKASLIGVGKNTYGHPTQETLSNLEAVGSQIYRSDLCGNVACTFALDAMEISSDR